jgi:PAS domain S-box-containing protein
MSKINNESIKVKKYSGLLDVLEQFVELSALGKFDVNLEINHLPPKETGIFQLLLKILNNYKDILEFNNIKYSLVSKSLDVALWDMLVDPSDPTGSNNEFCWSDEFRHLLGFSDEHDFPNLLSSWADRLHPEDKNKTLQAFSAHLNDYTGRTPYNVKYRLQNKVGEYVWLRADGATIRTSKGIPIRVAGSVQDISSQLKKDEIDKFINEFTVEIEMMMKSMELIQSAADKLKIAQEKNLQVSIKSEKNTSETKSIVSEIKNIAAKTNILALNASVEAARSGEYGKGFAVVAEEIRALAIQSSTSSSQIEEKLKAIQESSVHITDDIKNTVSLVTEQEQIIAEQKSAVENLIKTYNELADLIKTTHNT